MHIHVCLSAYLCPCVCLVKCETTAVMLFGMCQEWCLACKESSVLITLGELSFSTSDKGGQLKNQLVYEYISLKFMQHRTHKKLE